MLTTYQVFYTIHKCCPNAIHLLYTVLLHVMNVLPTHQIWDYLTAVFHITVT